MKLFRNTNVGTTERIASSVLGGALVFYGLKQRKAAGLSLAAVGTGLLQRGVTGHCPLYNTLNVDTAHNRENSPVPATEGLTIQHAVTINQSAAELYTFWRDFENLPRFMEHLQSVTVKDETHSHWAATAPAGQIVEWDAEITQQIENKQISWRSLEGADVPNQGTVLFNPMPSNRGTEVRVTLEYWPPAGKVGAAVAKLWGEDPQKQLEDDLRHLKQWVEAGEAPTTHGQPSGPRTLKGRSLQTLEG